jgi:DNA-binding MarR family transcriptional regulator
LYRQHRAAGLTGEALADFQAWGVPRNKLFARTLDRTRSAVVSRALQRLEERGLLRRRNSHGRDRYNAECPGRGPGKQRTTHLQLTPDGEALAQWLEKENANG